jgi:hypothetical protein
MRASADYAERMKRGDDIAAARVPAQPSTHDGRDDFVDTDTAATLPAPRVEPDSGVGPEVDAEVDSDFAADAGEDTDAVPALDERSARILAFERQWWRQAGSKEQAIRDTFGLSATRYYQLLNALLDDPVALALEPVVIQRLRRLRVSRTRSRGSTRRS